MDDGAFFDLALEVYEPSPGTPDLGDPLGPRGIWIAGPRRLPLSRGVWPLCGSMRLWGAEVGRLGADMVEAVVVVLEDLQRGRSVSFSLQPGKTPVAPPKPPDPDDFSPRSLHEAYFNVDLMIYGGAELWAVQPGPHVLYALLGERRSNALELEVIDDRTGEDELALASEEDPEDEESDEEEPDGGDAAESWDEDEDTDAGPSAGDAAESWDEDEDTVR